MRQARTISLKKISSSNHERYCTGRIFYARGCKYGVESIHRMNCSMEDFYRVWRPKIQISPKKFSIWRQNIGNILVMVKRSTWKGRSHIIGVLIDLSLSLQYLQNDTLFTSLTSKTHMLKLGLSYKQTIKSDWFWLMFCLKEIEWAKSLTKLEPSSSCLVGLAALPRIP